MSFAHKHILSGTALFLSAVVFGVFLGYEDRLPFPSSARASDCSDFNEDEGMCVGTDGCEWIDPLVCEDIVDPMECGVTAHCVDEYEFDCSSNADASACEVDGAQGCFPAYGDCNVYDEFDCDSQEGCSWDGAMCNGLNYQYCDGPSGAFTGCTGGEYEPAQCTGTYDETVCGDGVPEGGEQCDDGGTDNFDGCSAGCTVEEGWDCYGTPTVCSQCGDGTLNDDFAGEPGEQCDDGNDVGNDGCGTFAACYIDPGWSCNGASPTVCAEDSECGNGAIEGGEECDDANAEADDGCSETCAVEAGFNCEDEPSTCTRAEICGDGYIIGAESCDDGNTANGDGCNNMCFVDADWTCEGEPSACTEDPVCGNGMLEAGEQCDDGSALEIVDGCTASCTIDDGWSCDGDPSTCTQDPYCGDGEIIAEEEQCDDGNFIIGDGCDNGCSIEEGWSCDEGAPSMCSEDPYCGDGFLSGGEACDDGAVGNGDGCSDSCTVEVGYSCSGEPSECFPLNDGYECGNGELETDNDEECDDGNTTPNDGCSGMCLVEDGYACTEESPSTCEAVSGSSSSSSSSTGQNSSSSSDPAAPQGGGGGRGGAESATRAPAEGRATGVMSNEASEKPIVRPAASVTVQDLSDIRAADKARKDIEIVARKGIMTGYADDAGRSKGIFGASDPLTYGQVAKIAVLIRGDEPIASGPLKNRTARGDWSEGYMRAAERGDLPAFRTVMPVTAAPTKKAVVEILLKAAGISYGDSPDAALRKAKELGIASDVHKRALTRRETAIIVSKLISVLEEASK